MTSDNATNNNYGNKIVIVCFLTACFLLYYVFYSNASFTSDNSSVTTYHLHEKINILIKEDDNKLDNDIITSNNDTITSDIEEVIVNTAHPESGTSPTVTSQNLEKVKHTTPAVSRDDMHLNPPTQTWAQLQFTKALRLLGVHYGSHNKWTKCLNPGQTYFFPSIETVFTGVPKSGCSNWIEALLRAEGRLTKPLNSTMVFLVHGSLSTPYRMYSFPSDLQLESSKNADVIDKTLQNSFSFTVIRNPWTRIVSGYRDKLSNETTQGRNQRGFGMRIVSEMRNITIHDVKAEDLYPTFEELLRYLLLKKGTNNIHFMPQHRILCIPQSKYDYIIPLEYASALHDDVFQHINTSVRLLGSYDKKNDPRMQTSAVRARDWFSHIDSSITDDIYKLYRVDFTLLNYSNFTDLDFPLPLHSHRDI